MADTVNSDWARLIAEIKGLELKARAVVEGEMSGLHRSPDRGVSVEFAEHREYAPGDDLRYLDWKIYGRRDRFYLKQFEEETNLPCYLLVDASESMRYRSETAPIAKFDYARILAAALAYLVTRQQDTVGLSVFDDAVRAVVPPGGNASHFKQIVSVLEGIEPTHETSLGRVFHELAERLPRRGVVVILSDFFDDPNELAVGLRHFRHRRHDVRLLQIIDAAEESFPFESLTLFRGLEGFGQQTADPKSLGEAYRQEFREFLSEMDRTARMLSMSRCLARTEEQPGNVLTRMLS